MFLQWKKDMEPKTETILSFWKLGYTSKKKVEEKDPRRPYLPAVVDAGHGVHELPGRGDIQTWPNLKNNRR